MKWLRLLLFSALFLSLPQMIRRDFKLPPIHAHFPSNPNWEMPPPSEELLKILNQPFIYYSRGNQSSVFESQDGKYVLKLFRYRRSIFPIVHFLQNGFKKKPKKNFGMKMNKTLNAAHLAYKQAGRFTQVIYCHLNLTQHLFSTLQLRADQKVYNLPLDRYRFVLQRKASPFKETLLAARSEPEKMRRLIESFALLLIERSSLNIRNSDPNLGPNFGFIEEKAVEIDFGNYQKIEWDRKRQKGEISHFLMSLELWLAQEAPEHLSFMKDLRRKIEISYDCLSEAP